jgi:7-cyano-7-deazaguanine synthase
MENKRALLLLSGGIDSTTLLAKLTNEKFEVYAVSFNYGQKHALELKYAQQNADKYGVKEHKIVDLAPSLFASSALVNREIDITTYRNHNSHEGPVNAYVPFRNLIFISCALSMAESLQIDAIYLACNNDDKLNFWDCRQEFFHKINEITGANSSIQIHTPFLDFSKKDVVKLSQQLKVDLNETITCYQPIDDVECKSCLSCQTKQNALKNV